VNNAPAGGCSRLRSFSKEGILDRRVQVGSRRQDQEMSVSALNGLNLAKGDCLAK
jgi:hypothetical protein